MSTNMCSDLLLLTLVPKERISSITALGRDAAEQIMPGAADGVMINRGTAEEIVAQKPDLILASPWSTPVMRRMAKTVGAPMVEIESANSFADIRRITRQVGALVDEAAQAEALIREMDRKLAALQHARRVSPLTVIAWNGVDLVPASGTLTDAIIRAAGAINLANQLGHDGPRSLSIEELLVAQPDVIMRDRDGIDAPVMADVMSDHRAVRRVFAGRRVTYPVALHTCGLPQSADAAVELNKLLAGLPD